MEPIFVYVTCKDRAEAFQVGKALVEERLAACANVIDGMESIYWWKGQLEVGKEAVLILKSRYDLLEELTKKVKLEHSYEVPCVVAMPIKGGNQDYMNWLLAETKAE
ncbi:divalent-cation tolerance protein CutA [Calothrix membranacea FACHB-236]|nr:divalent-cation tolerance protein CutA [Calothrix membranacea FACHB-236]